MPNADAILVQRDPNLDGVVLPAEIVDRLMDYMSALTDDRARNLSSLVPVAGPKQGGRVTTQGSVTSPRFGPRDSSFPRDHRPSSHLV